MRTLVLHPKECSLEEAIRESARLLPTARRARSVVLSAIRIRPEPVVVLGRLQHAGRVLDWPAVEASGARVLRRVTTGTGFSMDGGVLVSLALPYVDAIFADATPRTFLNRNVRPIMRGLDAAGISTSYFGREWIAARKGSRALAVLGAEIQTDGTMLIEAFVSQSGSLVIDPALSSPLEASCDRYRGRPPSNLSALGATEVDLDKLLRGATERIGLDAARLKEVTDPAETDPEWVTDASNPLPQMAKRFEPRAIPIGFLDLAAVDREVWIGGDVIAPSFALGRYASWARDAPANSLELPMEGALWDDVRRAYDMAQHQVASMSR